MTFAFSLGLGIIFLLAGTFSGIISAMPKGGEWMNRIKLIFAVLLIGGGIYILNLITPPWLDYILWGILLIATSIVMGLFKPFSKGNLKAVLGRIFLVVIFIIGLVSFYQAVKVKFFSQNTGDESVVLKKMNWISSLEVAKSKAADENKKIMIDTYADWCVACKELDKYTFSAPEVQEILKDYILVKLDFTQNNQANKFLKKSLKIIGMPTIVFLDSQGKELKRFSGFKKKQEFIKFVQSIK